MLTFLLLIPFMTWSHQQIQFPQDDGRTKEATMLGLAEKRVTISLQVEGVFILCLIVIRIFHSEKSQYAAGRRE